jgi:hypothetical protein
MTEAKAIALIFLAMCIVMAAVCVGLGAVNASGVAYGVALVLVGGAAGHASSRVIVHYAPLRRQRQS